MRDDESSFSNHSLSDMEQDSFVQDDVSCCSPEQETNVSQKAEEPLVKATTTTTSPKEDQASFLSLRITYLIVTLVVMLADGLQGKEKNCRLVVHVP